MATIGFKGFGWLLSIATVSPACYMVSSQVAGERARVEGMERAIIQAKRDIRGLETEFDTRASMSQLEHYNGEVLALAAPRPDQYVTSEASLASLQAPQDMMHYASMVVPSAVAEPTVQTQAQGAQAAQAAPAPAPGTPVSQRAPIVAVSAPAPVIPAAATSRVASKPKPQTVAMLDRKLLSDNTLGDLLSSARSERKSR